MSVAELHDYRPGIKVPPHSIEAEQAVLGGLLLDPGRSWHIASALLSEDDFYRTDHRLIWRAIAGLMDGSAEVDVLTVARAIEDAGYAGRGVDVAYLAEIVDAVPGVSNLRGYAGVVRDRSILRRIISAANRMADLAFSPEGRNSAQIVEEAEREVADIAAQRAVHEGPSTMPDALRRYVDRMDRRAAGQETRVMVGLRDFDAHHRGFEETDLVVLAGRPSMGKTTAAMAMAENVALAGRSALVFSLEMSESELMERSVARFSGLSTEALRGGQLTRAQYGQMTEALKTLRGMPLLVDETGGLHVNQIRARARRAHREHDLSLIVVDYLQLVRGDGNSPNERTQHISRTLKEIAKELRCPVVALSQLNRELERRPVHDRRPRNSDLRDSGAIEQDADRIVMCYRHEVYEPETPRAGVLELITTKFRNGRLGVDYALADLARSHISDTPSGWQIPAEKPHKPARFDGKRDDDIDL